MNNVERWEWIERYMGFYKVSSRGRIRSYLKSKRGRLKKLEKCKQGYRSTRLYYGNGQKREKAWVHRLVAETFIGKAPGRNYVVHHKNGIRDDNGVENLEWITNEENLKLKGINGYGKYGYYGR